MTPRELGEQLRTFIAGRRHDPVADPFEARATAIEAQLETATARRAKERQAVEDATFVAEEAYVKGLKVDTTARQRLRAALAETEDTIGTMSRALERVRLDIATARAARAARDIATLTPIFRALVGAYDERAAALVEIQDLLELAHTTANNVLPGVASSVLQQGFGGLLTRENFDTWRTRVEAAGLLATKTQRAA